MVVQETLRLLQGIMGTIEGEHNTLKGISRSLATRTSGCQHQDQIVNDSSGPSPQLPALWRQLRYVFLNAMPTQCKGVRELLVQY